MADDKETRIPVQDGDDKSGGRDFKVEDSFSGDLDASVEAAREAEAAAQQADGLSEVESLRNRVSDLEERLLRSMADFENYRKRTARQFEDISRNANDRLIGEILELADNFDRAMQHANGEADIASLRKGMEMIQSQLTNLLAKNDIKPVESLGKPFDPNLHDALMQVPTTEYPEGVVALEMGRGYVQGDRVIRHARVGVSTGRAREDEK